MACILCLNNMDEQMYPSVFSLIVGYAFMYTISPTSKKYAL